MNAIFRLVLFEFALIRMLFFRVILERMINTVMAAVAGFLAVYANAVWGSDQADFDFLPLKESSMQAMILFAFLYAETIMANWQYMTNKTGRMELIFNSTQPPLLIVFIKNFASGSVTLTTLILLYVPLLLWFGLPGALNAGFLLAALATLFVCCSVMTFNAFFEFRVKQIKALTSVLNLVLPYLATRYALQLPDAYGFVPYFNGVKFIALNNQFGIADVGWLFLTAAVTGLAFLALSQLVVRRIRATASVYLE